MPKFLQYVAWKLLLLLMQHRWCSFNFFSSHVVILKIMLLVEFHKIMIFDGELQSSSPENCFVQSGGGTLVPNEVKVAVKEKIWRVLKMVKSGFNPLLDIRLDVPNPNILLLSFISLWKLIICITPIFLFCWKLHFHYENSSD